jgi:hypothetical protein
VSDASGFFSESLTIRRSLLFLFPVCLRCFLRFFTDNSSRFGKWMKVGLNGHFLIQGCEIINYLLEKSRVVTQSTMEVKRLLCGTCVTYAAGAGCRFWYELSLWALTSCVRTLALTFSFVRTC